MRSSLRILTGGTAAAFWGMACILLALSVSRGAWIPAVAIVSGASLFAVALHFPSGIAMFWMAGMPTVFIFLNKFLRAIPAVTAGRFLSVFLVAAVAFRALLGKDHRGQPVPVLDKLILLFLGSVVLSMITTVPERTGNELYKGIALLFDGFLLPFSGYLVARNLRWNVSSARRFLSLMTVVGLYLTIAGFLQYFFKVRFFLPAYLELTHEMDRATGSFANPVEYGAVMVVLLLLTLLQYARARDRMLRALLLTVSAAMTAGILLSKTRGVWISFLVSMVFVARKDARIRKPLAIGLAGGIACLLVAAPFLAQSDLFYRRVTESSSIYNRVALYATAANMIAHNPVLGIGFGHDAFKEAKREYIVSVGSIGSWYATPGVPHNEFLHILVLTGLAGTIPFILMLREVYRSVDRAEKAPGGEGTLRSEMAMYCKGIFVVFLVNAMLADMIFFSYFMTLLYFLLGMTVSLEAGPASPAGGPRRRSARRNGAGEQENLARTAV